MSDEALDELGQQVRKALEAAERAADRWQRMPELQRQLKARAESSVWSSAPTRHLGGEAVAGNQNMGEVLDLISQAERALDRALADDRVADGEENDVVRAQERLREREEELAEERDRDGLPIDRPSALESDDRLAADASDLVREQSEAVTARGGADEAREAAAAKHHRVAGELQGAARVAAPGFPKSTSQVVSEAAAGRTAPTAPARPVAVPSRASVPTRGR